MKTISILILTGCALLCLACHSNPVQEIPGTYVCTYQNEYSKGNDTLEVSTNNSDGGAYQIYRRTGYQKIRSGKILPVEYKQVKWTATYNKDKQVLEETAFGRQVYIAKDLQSLTFADTRYQRLK